jgi:hypothetical protein
VGLRGIFEDSNPGCGLENFAHRRRTAIQMDRDDCSGPRPDGHAEACRIQIARAIVDVGEHGCGAGRRHRRRRRDEGIGGNDDLASGPDA